jgi:predicted MFS family arabinose efflux permease
MNRLTFIILCLEGAVLSFSVAAAAALVPSIARDFALSQFIVGRIIWIYMLPYGLAALVYGPLARSFDAKKIELICLFGFCLASLFAGLSGGIHMLFAARFFMGVFGASVVPLALILIARQMGASGRGKFVGIFFGATFVASLTGLILSAVLDWRLNFIIPALCGFLLLPVMYFYLPSFKPDSGKIRINYLRALKDKTVINIFSYIFIISLLYHGVQQWLGVYFSTELFLNQIAISLLVTLTSLSGVFGEVAGGWLTDSLGRRKTINLGVVLMAAGVFTLVFKMPVFALALVMIAWGAGWTFNHCGISTVITDLPGEFLNEAASLNSSVRFISGGLGVFLGGLILQRSFIQGFIIFGLALILLLIVSKRISSSA